MIGTTELRSSGFTSGKRSIFALITKTGNGSLRPPCQHLRRLTRPTSSSFGFQIQYPRKALLPKCPQDETESLRQTPPAEHEYKCYQEQSSLELFHRARKRPGTGVSLC